MEIGTWLHKVLANANLPVRRNHKLTTYNTAICVHRLTSYERFCLPHDTIFVHSYLPKSFKRHNLAFGCLDIIIKRKGNARIEVQDVKTHSINPSHLTDQKIEHAIKMPNYLWRKRHRKTDLHVMLLRIGKNKPLMDIEKSTPRCKMANALGREGSSDRHDGRTEELKVVERKSVGARRRITSRRS
jgi:hypothetical protein